MSGLQAKLTAMLGLMLLVALALTAVLFQGTLGERRVAERYALMESAAGHVNVAAGFQAIERGVGTTLLGQAAPSPELRVRFLELQAKGDAEVEAAEAQVAGLLALGDREELARRLAAWRQARQALRSARPQVLTGGLEKQAWIGLASDHIDAGFRLRDALFSPRDRREQVLIYNAVLRANVATLCEYAGRERATVGGAIASGLPITPQQEELLRGHRALVDHAVAGVLALREDASTPPGLAAAIDAFRAEFLGPYQALRQAVYAASREHRPYPVAGPEWIARSTRAIDTGLAISAAVGTLSTRAAADIEREARAALRFDTALLGAAVLVFALVVRFVRRRVVAPVTAVIEGLVQASTQITEAAAGVAGSSQGLAAGASEQAAALEQTNATLEEVSQRGRRNAAHGASAGEAMGRTVRVVGEGSTAMRDMDRAMDEIKEASGSVSRILKTIEALAFQTNLLALNASVEAARAGDQGRGFAVVAAEVGSLAERSSVAARDSAEQVAAVARTTAAGSAIAGRLGQALKAVEDLSARASSQVGAIAAESEEQARGVSQVNEAVSQMSQVVQRNAASAEESAAAAEQLSAQAEVLRSYVRSLRALVSGRAA